jgi:steroid delta-isomerase-like uncharacterized protein
MNRASGLESHPGGYTMSEQENARAAVKFFEAINGHDLSRYSELLSPDFRSDQPGAAALMNEEQNNAYTQVFIDAFPDLNFDIRQTIAQGDFVAVNWVASGTHKGGLKTPTGAVLPATGKRAIVPGSSTYQFKGGKIVHVWNHWDMVTLLAQLALMPGM